MNSRDKIAIIFNPQAGRTIKPETLYKDFQRYSITSKIEIIKKKTLLKKAIAKDWKAGIKIFVAAGGDGTISAVASAIIELGINAKLGVIPLGTLNHFSRDIGIPTTISKAIKIIAKGKSMYIDIAKVNDRYFLNNSNLGFYPYIVSERDNRKSKKFAKWLRLTFASLKALKKYPYVTVEFKSKGKKFRRKSPFIFIGNNIYELRAGRLGMRHSLNQGKLSVFIAQKVSRVKIIILVWRALNGTLNDDHDFDRIGLSKLTITSSRQKRLKVSFDGEVAFMKTPICYSIHPRALRVIIP